MNLEKAAQALVECGYALAFVDGVLHCDASSGIYLRYEEVDPINNEAQRQALLEWFKVSVNYDGDIFWWAEDGKSFVAKSVAGKTRIEAENACLEEILK